MQQSTIHLESVQSLPIAMRVLEEELSVGTGFVVEWQGQQHLVTNRHNLAGRRSDNNDLMSPETGAVPDTVRIWHNAAQGLGLKVVRDEPLYDPEGRPLWCEHAMFGRQVDVVSLALTQLDGVNCYPHVLEPSARVELSVTSEVHVVGFPFGLAHHGSLAIWTRGTIATEYDVDWANLPCFLIDARTRPGQSGSPVLYFDLHGRAKYVGGVQRLMSTGGAVSQLLGVYSGRINEQSDLGVVWRSQAILDIVSAGLRPASN